MYSLWVMLCLLKFTSGAKILAVFWFPAISHQSVFQEISKELSLRGHQVTTITPRPLNDKGLVNLTEIDVSREAEEIMRNIGGNHHNSVLFSNNIIKLFVGRSTTFQTLIEVSLKEVKKLSSDPEKTFDLILVEAQFPLIFAVNCAFKAPVVGVSSFGFCTHIHDVLGNPSQPVLYPDFYFGFKYSSGILMKLERIFYSVYYRFAYYWYVLPTMEQVAKKYFKTCPYLGELESNVSLVLVNESPILHRGRPAVPNLINMGFVHIKKPRQLPQDLQMYLDKSEHGVVYFSLGSSIHISSFYQEVINIFFETFSELPYNILCKWEGDLLPDYPKNIKFSKWWPQQDLLHHRNIKVFVTQLGLQSLEEAIIAEVPMVGLPLYVDQFHNADTIVKLGIGVKLDSTKLTKIDLKNAILDVAENEQYRKQIQEIKKLVLDQPMTGLERAMWWIEYVIRNNGSSYLKSPSVGYPWVEYYFLDVFAVFVIAFIILVIAIRKILY